MHATHLPSPFAPTTLETKTLPIDHYVGLGTYSDAEALPAADKCRWSDRESDSVGNPMTTHS